MHNPDTEHITELPETTQSIIKARYDKWLPYWDEAVKEFNPEGKPLYELKNVLMHDIMKRADELMKEAESKKIQEIKEKEKQTKQEENDDDIPF